MRILYFVLTLPSLAISLADEHCSWGPSYWCSSLPQASVCSATDHCINQVWQDLAVPQDHGEVCKICKEMVDKARQLISANQTQDILKILEETSCGFIPIGLIAYECMELVEKYGPDLLKMMASKMNPIRVCTVMGLCNSAKVNALVKHAARAAREKIEQEKEIIDCSQCEEASKTLNNQLATNDRNKIVDNMLELCANVNVGSACQDTVLEQFQNIFNGVSEFLDSGVCNHNMICAQEFNAQDDQCQHCEKVVQFYIDVYIKNSSLAEFKMVLDSVCERLDEPNVDSCKTLVASYYRIIYEFLKKSVDPHKVCAIFEVCGHIQKDNYIPRIASQDDLSLGFKNISSSNIDTSCAVCESVLHELQIYLEDGQTQKQIKQQVNKICNVVPKYLRTGCHKFINSNEPALVYFLAHEIEPLQFCKLMHLCNHQGTKAAIVFHLNMTGSSCVLCKYVMTTLDGILEDKTNEKEIKDALETICSYLPMFSKQCDSFVEKYMDMIINLLTQGITPDQICIELGLCDSNDNLEVGNNNYVEIQRYHPEVLNYTKIAKLVTTDSCFLCKYVMTTLDGILEDKTNEQEIKDGLETICSYLPMYSKQCDSFVEKYTDVIINMLTQGITPDKICVELGLCDSYQNITASDGLKLKNNTNRDIDIQRNLPMVWEFNKTARIVTTDSSCILCKYVITTLDGILEDKTNEKEIKDALEAICSYLPMFSKQCDSFVEKYTDMIIDMLTNGITPDQICEELRLCGPKNDVNYLQVVSIKDKNEYIKMNDPISRKSNDTSPLCTLCNYVMEELHNAVEDKKNEDKIRQTLDVLCNQLSVPIRKQCLRMIKQFQEEIIDLFVKDTSPEMICSAIGVCVDNEINSNQIPNVAIEQNSSSKYVLNGDLQQRSSSSDKYLDQMCKLLSKLIKEKGLDPADLPKQKVAFHQTVLGVTWYGSAEVYNGKFKGLSTIHRSGGSSFVISDNVATEAAYISMENPTAHYNADASFMTLRVGAGVTVWISDVQMYIAANMDPLEHGSRPQISQFKITHIGDIVVHVEGLGPLNWILDSLVSCISNIIKRWIGLLVQGPLRDILQEVLNKIIPPI